MEVLLNWILLTVIFLGVCIAIVWLASYYLGGWYKMVGANKARRLSYFEKLSDGFHILRKM